MRNETAPFDPPGAAGDILGGRDDEGGLDVLRWPLPFAVNGKEGGDQAVSAVGEREDGESEAGMRRRIRVKTRCPADVYAAEGERIVEFFDPVTKQGGLISFRRLGENQLVIAPYCIDQGVSILVSEDKRFTPS
jgi:hypothetical protein